MRATAQSGVRQSSSTNSSFLTYAQGIVLEVSGTLAVVKLSTGTQVRVRTDMLPGKSDPPLAGERWLLDQAYGGWRFAVPIGYQKDPIQRYAMTVGNGVATSYTIIHGLGTQDVLVQAYNPISGAPLSPTITRTATDRVQVVFSPAPATNAARVVLFG